MITIPFHVLSSSRMCLFDLREQGECSQRAGCVARTNHAAWGKIVILNMYFRNYQSNFDFSLEVHRIRTSERSALLSDEAKVLVHWKYRE